MVESEHAQTLRELARAEAALEYLRRQAMEDAELRDLVRQRAWGRLGRLSLNGDGRTVVAPAGWPEGVDGDEEIERVVDERLGDVDRLRAQAARLGYRLVEGDQ
jgi:hypothetical protein